MTQSVRGPCAPMTMRPPMSPVRDAPEMRLSARGICASAELRAHAYRRPPRRSRRSIAARDGDDVHLRQEASDVGLSGSEASTSVPVSATPAIACDSVAVSCGVRRPLDASEARASPTEGLRDTDRRPAQASAAAPARARIARRPPTEFRPPIRDLDHRCRLRLEAGRRIAPRAASAGSMALRRQSMPRRRRRAASSTCACARALRSARTPSAARISPRICVAAHRGTPALALGPELLERAPLRRREIAMARPAAPERQPAKGAARAPERHRARPPQPRERVIEPRPLGRERPGLESSRARERAVAGAERALPPAAHEPGQRDLDRAHLLAAPAEARRVREDRGLADAEERRRQHGADRARRRPSRRHAADRIVDRAVVHAGAAADAAQDLAELAREQRRAAVVDDDHVASLRPVRVAGAARAGEKARVGRDVLAGGRSAPGRAAARPRPRASARPSRSTRRRCAPWAAAT